MQRLNQSFYTRHSSLNFITYIVSPHLSCIFVDLDSREWTIDCTAPIGSMDGSIVVESGAGDYSDFTTLQVHIVETQKVIQLYRVILFSSYFSGKLDWERRCATGFNRRRERLPGERRERGRQFRCRSSVSDMSIPSLTVIISSWLKFNHSVLATALEAQIPATRTQIGKFFCFVSLSNTS